MKTSIRLDDHIYQEAVRVARERRTTIGSTITEWARLGRRVAKARAERRRPRFTPVDLGEPLLDLTSRSAWMDALDR